MVVVVFRSVRNYVWHGSQSFLFETEKSFERKEDMCLWNKSNQPSHCSAGITKPECFLSICLCVCCGCVCECVCVCMSVCVSVCVCVCVCCHVLNTGM